MKKLAAFVLALTLCLTSLTACTKTENSTTGSDASASTEVTSGNSDEIITSGLDNLDLITEVYVQPLYPDVFTYNWADVTQIKTDDLLLSCYYGSSFEYERDNLSPNDTTVLANQVESATQQIFAVNSDYLRTSKYYNSKDITYQLDFATKSNFTPIAISAKLEARKLVIEVGSMLKGKTTPIGLLTVELYYGRNAKYISYRSYQQGNLYLSDITHDEIITPDLEDLNRVCSDYLDPLYTNVWRYSWNDVSEIKPDDLLNTCYLNNYMNYKRGREGDYYTNPSRADKVEWSLQQHFAVSSNYLRKSEYFNAEKQQYTIPNNPDGATAVALSAKKNGEQIIIEVGLSTLEDNTVTPLGLLTVEPIYGRQIKYVSYSVYESALKQLSIGD